MTKTCEENRINWRRELIEIFLLALCGFIMSYAMCGTCRDSLSRYFIVASFSAFIWIMMWKGNQLMSWLVSRWYSWLEYPMKRFVAGVIVMVVYTLLALYILLQFYRYQFGITLGSGYQMYFSTIVITVVISLFMHGKSFLASWKESAIEAERFQKEYMRSKYETLKNQVNPHFLFNSLNALTNLVYEDRDQAARFIKQLSQVYRYVLDTRDREIVTKEEELEFLEAYLFLQQIRFDKNLQVKINLNDLQTSFPPLVLQMLIENAIKHNIISSESPLAIRIYGEDGFVVVENSLKKKKVNGEESPGVGLENIKMRYQFLSDREVRVEETNQHFVVRLPVISIVES